MTKHTDDFTIDNKIRMAELANGAANAALKAILEYVTANPEIEQYTSPAFTAVVIGNIASTNNALAAEHDFCAECIAKAFQFGMVSKRLMMQGDEDVPDITH